MYSVSLACYYILLTSAYANLTLPPLNFHLSWLTSTDSLLVFIIYFLQDPNEDTEWNDILRKKGILPPKEEPKDNEEEELVFQQQSVGARDCFLKNNKIIKKIVLKLSKLKWKEVLLVSKTVEWRLILIS